MRTKCWDRHPKNSTHHYILHSGIHKTLNYVLQFPHAHLNLGIRHLVFLGAQQSEQQCRQLADATISAAVQTAC